MFGFGLVFIWNGDFFVKDDFGNDIIFGWGFFFFFMIIIFVLFLFFLVFFKFFLLDFYLFLRDD